MLRSNQAYLNLGSLAFFVDSHLDYRQDALDTQLFCQLWASEEFDRISDARDWYTVYRNKLRRVGWMTEDLHFVRRTIREPFAVEDALVDERTGDEEKLVISVVDQIGRMPASDRRLAILNKYTHGAFSGCFQATSYTELDGIPRMSLFACHFQSDKKITDLLKTRFSTDAIRFWEARQTVYLNTEVYNRFRSTIKNWLADRARWAIHDLSF